MGDVHKSDRCVKWEFKRSRMLADGKPHSFALRNMGNCPDAKSARRHKPAGADEKLQCEEI